MWNTILFFKGKPYKNLRNDLARRWLKRAEFEFIPENGAYHIEAILRYTYCSRSIYGHKWNVLYLLYLYY